MDLRSVAATCAVSRRHFDGSQRPDFAVAPAPGQESVWDYPRPPAVVNDHRCIEVFADGVRVAKTTDAIRVLETASPPVFYLPAGEVRRELLIPEHADSVCEWKGRASYWSLVMGNVTVRNVAWTYAQPSAEFEAITGYLAFYPGKLECCVDGERVTAQRGSLYGGWITADVVGPFKGESGTEAW